MLLSLLLTLASLDPSLQAQASTHVTKTADELAGSLGRRPVTLEEQIREFRKRAKALEEGNRKLAAKLLEARENTKKGK